MALIPKFEICVINNCTQIKFTETTGIYTASNQGGYGSPNPELVDVTTAVLTITSPDETEYIIDLLAEDFPSSTSDFSIILDIDLTSIIDGKWLFEYVVSTVSTSYTKTKYELFFCNSECCVKQLLTNLKLENCGCNCESIDYDTYIKASTLLDGLKKASSCGDVSSFTRIKTTLDKICLNSGCKTCK